MGDLGGQREPTHGEHLQHSRACPWRSPHAPQCGMWCEPSDTATFFGSRNTS
jgi:hypothetical protein